LVLTKSLPFLIFKSSQAWVAEAARAVAIGGVCWHAIKRMQSVPRQKISALSFIEVRSLNSDCDCGRQFVPFSDRGCPETPAARKVNQR